MTQLLFSFFRVYLPFPLATLLCIHLCLTTTGRAVVKCVESPFQHFNLWRKAARTSLFLSTSKRNMSIPYKSNRKSGLNFFQVLFTTTRFISVLSCEDLLISSLHRSANMWIFIYLKSSFTWMFICTQFIDQLPVGLLAQLVERCTGIAEVMGSYPVGPEFFSGPIYNYSFQ